MPSTAQILNDLIHLLKQDPGQPKEQVTRSLQQMYALSDSGARSLLARAVFRMDQETKGRRPVRRRVKPLPGETEGGMDNIIRVLEDAATFRDPT